MMTQARALRYAEHFSGRGFNVFVLIVQSFEKLKVLNPQAPQVGPPFAEPANTNFAVAQIAALIIFAALGFLALRRFRPAAPAL